MWIVIKTILAYVKSYKRLLILFLILFGLDLLFVSLAPLSFNYMIEYAVTPKNLNVFMQIVIIMLSAGVICTIAGVIADRILSKLNALVEQNMRERLFIKLQQLQISFFQNKRVGDSVALFSTDIPTISSTMISLLSTGIQSVVVVVVSMSVLLYLEWSMALLIIFGASLIFVGPLLMSKRTKAGYEAYKQHAAGLNSEVTENIKAQRLVKSYNLQHTMLQRFQRRTKLLFMSSYNMNVINAALGRIPMISLLLVNLSIMVVGSYLVIIDRITIGELIAFYTMYMSMGNSVYSLTFIIPTIADTKVSIERMSQTLNEDGEIGSDSNRNDSKGKNAFTDEAGRQDYREIDIKLDGVSFGYEAERYVLSSIDLSIPYGSNVALVGSSGSGKSSMVQLLLGLYKPNRGEITINGARLEHENLACYRNHLAVVFQDNFLFQGTIKENILLGKEGASDEEMYSAARLAEIHDYILSLPEGYDTAVLDEGSNFSGGQRQRLAIARALIRDPRLLILDEATSALDPATEAALNGTIKKLSAERTIISVTHRLSTVTDCDLVCVFQQGKLVEQGRHEQLLAAEGQYHYLWEKQTGFTFSEEGEDVEIDAARLSKLNFFKQVSHELLEDISMLFNTERYEKEALIIRQGDRGEKFYILIRGRVEVLKHERNHEGDEEATLLAVLEDGDHFGEIALLHNIPRTATIKAMTDCVVITLQRKMLQHLLAKHPEINDYVRKVLQERIR